MEIEARHLETLHIIAAYRANKKLPYGDAYGAGAIGLIKALKHYDDTYSGDLYIERSIHNSINSWVRLDRKHKRKGKAKGQQGRGWTPSPFRNMPPEEELAKHSHILQTVSAECKLERRDLCNYLLSFCTKRQRLMIVLYMNGYDLGEIRDALGTTKQSIHDTINRGIRRILNGLRESKSSRNGIRSRSPKER